MPFVFPLFVFCFHLFITYPFVVYLIYKMNKKTKLTIYNKIDTALPTKKVNKIKKIII